MNVFILSTGRCGSKTFSIACNHIDNYSSAHESRTYLRGNARFDYPHNHIESDNRLAWLLGRLDAAYGQSAFYVHLTRDINTAAESFLKRWNYGIMQSYHENILWHFNSKGRSRAVRLGVCRDFYYTVNANIELFLRDKPLKMDFMLENAKENFAEFWERIGARGDYQSAIREWDTSHNKSDLVAG